MTIKLLQEPYICGGEYRLHTEDGRPATGVLQEYYTARATDGNGGDYSVYWEMDENGDYNANDPVEVYNWQTNKPVEVEGVTVC